MRSQIILVDFENVQPDLVPALALEDVHVRVFVGPHQPKLATDVVVAMQELGDRAKYVRVAKQGPDALDMHLAFYLGQLSQQFPEAYFHVVAKDRDYDSLLAHLKSLGIFAAKAPDLASIPLFKRALTATLTEQVEVAASWLRERSASRPKTIKTLRNSLKTAVFSGRLEDGRIDSLMEELKVRGVFSFKDQKVDYTDA